MENQARAARVAREIVNPLGISDVEFMAVDSMDQSEIDRLYAALNADYRKSAVTDHWPSLCQRSCLNFGLPYAERMENKTTRFYELHYRTGKIVCNVQKSSESEFWRAHGRAEFEQDHVYYCKPISLADRLANEEDAKNKLIELAKNWIDGALREL